MPPRATPPSAPPVTRDTRRLQPTRSHVPPDRARPLPARGCDEWRLASLGLLAALVVTSARSRSRRSCSARSTTRSCRATAASCGRTSGGIAVLALIRCSSTTSGATSPRASAPIENEMRRRLYAAYLTYPRRVLRPPRHGPGALARDERPVPGALLHRLGRHPDVPERDDDRRRLDHPAVRQPAARGLRRRGDARPSRT